MPELVAIDLPGGPEFVAALQWVWERGDAALPVDRRLAAPARQRLLDAMAPFAILAASGLSPLAGGGRPVEDGDALVVATSGTTGEFKGVVLTHAAVEASARATTARLAVDPSRHRWLACLPLSHVGGLSVVTRALVTGTPLEVHAGFDAAAVMAAAGPEVLVSLVATALRRVDAALFWAVVLGGSAPPEDLPANVVTTYGMTETGSGVVYDGWPLDGVEVAIGAGAGAAADGEAGRAAGAGGEAGRAAGAGGVAGAGAGRAAGAGAGEIRLRGPMLLRAYRDGSVPLDAAGWLATGDAGSIGPDGRLHVDGRLSELIISGGENVWPSAVEAVLRTHAGVAEVAVAGRPDPEWGEQVVAWVVPADPARPPSLEGLRSLVKEQLAAFAAPRRLVLVNSLPKTAIGKVRRRLLE